MALATDWPVQQWVGLDKHPGLRPEGEEKKLSGTSENRKEDDDSDTLDDSVASIDDSISQISVEPPPLPPAPTGELTLSFIFSHGLSWKRRALLFTAVVAIMSCASYPSQSRHSR